MTPDEIEQRIKQTLSEVGSKEHLVVLLLEGDQIFSIGQFSDDFLHAVVVGLLKRIDWEDICNNKTT